MKQQIDTNKEEELEQYRRQLLSQISRDRDGWQRERNLKMEEVERAIDGLNLSRGDKSSLREEVSKIERDQRDLLHKVEQREKEDEEEREKKRKLQKEIN